MTKAKQAEAVAEVPDSFLVLEDGAIRAMVAALKRLEVDHSGFDKARRELRPVAWRQYCHGGSATTAREQIQHYEAARGQAAARLEALKARGLPVAEAEGQIVGLDENIRRLAVLVQAAGDGPDQKTRQAATKAAQDALATARARLDPYHRARIPAPPELEDVVIVAEDADAEASAAFSAGRRKLDQLGAEVRTLTTQAISALLAAADSACVMLGGKARALVTPDLDRLVRLPHRAPPEAGDLAGEAADLEALMSQLGAVPGRGMARFWEACGPEAAFVVATVSGFQAPPPPERPVRGESVDVEA